ncbi:uncharacterized protein C24B11.05 isoform X2 [Selaginella moellendorffii]|uniref:uncharacterized protein C24B11.05 isoform X2 n=1 Tax=Selaginella moellendorffii TaxID=88036 RepID=UPI000D1CE83E|nr:uncharacterized protein C24B11.05 isoform X2 [Selaginella moellendorffii]|eukprot:XP_002967383.2 uncharacterized protein C24B11.05 isoform X2 [Selaginella moellendorffii]
MGNEKKHTHFDCLLFDLDDTLYPFSLGIAEACRQNIEEYMVDKLGIDKSIATDLGQTLYRCHGTTMAGLRATGYNFDYDDFHNYVHGRLPYDLLKPNPELREMLLSMPQRKYVFTNADKNHASKALHRMGLEDCFDTVICFETIMGHEGTDMIKKATGKDKRVGRQSLKMVESSTSVAVVCKPEANNTVAAIICKPSPEAMKRAVEIINVDAKRALFFDDSPRNIAAGKAVGLHTVLVGNVTKCEGADYAIANIVDARKEVPIIWD